MGQIMVVHGGTWQYMKTSITVYSSTIRYKEQLFCSLSRFMVVHDGTLSGFLAPAGLGWADFGALLKALHCLHHQWQLLQVIASTNSFIHALAPLTAPPWPRVFVLAFAGDAFPAAGAASGAAASAAGTGNASQELTPAPPAAEETSAGGGGGGGGRQAGVYEEIRYDAR
jgi:hypothetical protein